MSSILRFKLLIVSRKPCFSMNLIVTSINIDFIILLLFAKTSLAGGKARLLRGQSRGEGGDPGVFAPILACVPRSRWHK